MPAEAASESAICAKCGMCCTGTLFDFGELAADEVTQLKQLGAVFYPGSNPAIAFPCALLKGNRCSQYQSRPRVCQAYRCKVLQHRAAGSIDDEQALHLIAKALELKLAVDALLPPGQSLAQARRTWQDEPEFWKDQAEPERSRSLQLIMALAALNLHLDRHFRYEGQRVIRAD